MKNVSTIISRILGVVATIFCFFTLFKSFSVFSWSWSWFFLFSWIIFLSVLTVQGWLRANIPVGSTAQLLFLGTRLGIFLGEGKNWIPWPFGEKVEDTRKKTVVLDPIEMLTKDGIKVKIPELSMVIQITDLNKYNDVNPTDLKQLYDDVIDSNVRHKIRTNDLEQVLSMTLSMDEAGIAQDLSNFGVNIIKVIVPRVVPADEKTQNDMELKKREQLQREGQRIQVGHQARLISFLKGKNLLDPSQTEGPDNPRGPGLSDDKAYEASLIHMEKAENKKIASNTFGLDDATIKSLVAAVLSVTGGKK